MFDLKVYFSVQIYRHGFSWARCYACQRVHWWSCERVHWWTQDLSVGYDGAARFIQVGYPVSLTSRIVLRYVLTFFLLTELMQPRIKYDRYCPNVDTNIKAPQWNTKVSNDLSSWSRHPGHLIFHFVFTSNNLFSSYATLFFFDKCTKIDVRWFIYNIRCSFNYPYSDNRRRSDGKVWIIFKPNKVEVIDPSNVKP